MLCAVAALLPSTVSTIPAQAVITRGEGRGRARVRSPGHQRLCSVQPSFPAGRPSPRPVWWYVPLGEHKGPAAGPSGREREGGTPSLPLVRIAGVPGRPGGMPPLLHRRARPVPQRRPRHGLSRSSVKFGRVYEPTRSLSRDALLPVAVTSDGARLFPRRMTAVRFLFLRGWGASGLCAEVDPWRFGGTGGTSEGEASECGFRA